MWQASLLEETLRVEDLGKLSLVEFAKGSRAVEFTCPWAPVTLFLVPHPKYIASLLERGITRGRIWLADEVRDLLAAGIGRDDLAKIVESKLLFDGFVERVTKAGQ